MEPIYKIQTIQTKDNLRRAAARIMRTKLIIHVIILSILACAFTVFVLYKRIDSAYFFAVVFGMACIGLAVFRFDNVPKKYAEKTYSDMISVHKEPIISNIIVASNSISVENCQLHTVHRYELEDITGMLEASTLFLLKTKKGTYIILDKSGFFLGTADEFRDFCKKRL